MTKLTKAQEKRIRKAIVDAFYYFDSPEAFAEAIDKGFLHDKVVEITADELARQKKDLIEKLEKQKFSKTQLKRLDTKDAYFATGWNKALDKAIEILNE